MRIIGECPICHAENQLFEKGQEELVECLACGHTFPENLVIDDDTTPEELEVIREEITCWNYEG